MMFDTKLDFKKVDIDVWRKDGRQKTVRVSKSRMTISQILVNEVGWVVGDRVDLLQAGSMFALERSSVGLFTLVPSNKGSKTLVINSINLCRHIRTVTLEDCVMKGMVDGKRIIFWKNED